MTGEPPITDVTGGSHGMTVAYDHALALAGDYDAAGGRMREWAGRSGGVLLDGDLLESALLSPVSFAEAEAAVLAATSGPDGVLVASVVWEADAVTIRVAVRATQLTDELVAQTWEVLDHQLGVAVGYTVAAGAPALVLSAAGLALLWTQLPPGTQTALQDKSLDELQEWLVDHPEAVQHLVNGSGGLLEGLWDGLTPVTPGGPLGVPLLVPDTESAAGLLAALYSDGHHQTTPSPLAIPGSETAPADLAALVQHLAQVDAQPNGTVEVQTIRTADGSVRHVVYLPGTDDLTTTPWSQDADVRDLGTNFLLVSGQDNAYQQGILDAMQQAGVRPGEPVALVGHSQGGMEAAVDPRPGLAVRRHPRRHRRRADRAPRRLPPGQPRALAGEPRRRRPAARRRGQPRLRRAGDGAVRRPPGDGGRQPRPRSVRPRRPGRPGQRRPLDPRAAQQSGSGRFRRVRGWAGGHQPGLPDHPGAVSGPSGPSGLVTSTRGNGCGDP